MNSKAPGISAPVFTIEPRRPALPIIFDSPHSGFELPADFGTVATRNALLTSWDAFVDELWGGVPDIGGVLIGATFPRCYIDPNRSATDIDEELLEEAWPGHINPEKYTRAGMGLIRRYALPGMAMYDRKLPICEVQGRIDNYYKPYRDALEKAIESAVSGFGKFWHVDCHSMKSRGNAMNVDNGASRPDFVVSDRLGKTSNTDFTEWAATELRKLGYSVKINDPYQGGDILEAFSDPALDRNSIQIEVNRGLYMDEKSFVKSENFSTIRADLDRFVASLASYVRGRLSA